MEENISEPISEPISELISSYKLQGKIKKFDKKLYDKYDIPARNKIKKQLGEYVKDNPDIYAQDMLLDIPNYKYKYLELQVCAGWTSENYPYKYPYIYERKKYFSEDTLYIIFNKNMTRGLLFNNKSIEEKPHRIKKYSRTYVYDIPWNRILPINIDDLDMETIMLY